MPVRDLLSAAAGVGGAADPYFYDVSLLLTGDGTNGAQNNTFLDSSTNNFTITRNGNTTQGTFSPYGSLWSNYFDGSSAAFSISDNAAFNLNTGAFTIEAWVNNSSLSGYQTMISKRAAVWEMGLSNNLLYWWVGSTVYTTTATIPKGQWTHVAVSSDGTNVKLFVNGTLDSTVSSATPGSGASSVYVGYAGSGQYFPGYISNLRVVKGTQLYTTTFTPSTTPLTAVSGTSLLTCQSNRFIDNSSNNFTLTVNGSPSVQRFSPFNPTAPYSASTIGGSGYFDGSGDYLSTAANTALNLSSDNFTIEFWMNAASFPVETLPISATDASNTYSYAPYLSYGKVMCVVNTTGNGLLIPDTGVTLSTNTWYHIAYVRNGNTFTTYINGTGYAPTSISGSFVTATTLGIGGRADGNFPFNGYMSNVRIVKGTAVYTSNFTPPTAPLTAITNTSLLCNFTNAGIPDAAMMNDLETVGNAQVSTSVKKYGTGSIYFNGSASGLTAAKSNSFGFGTGDFTWEAWVYPTNLTGFQCIFSSDDGNGHYVYIGMTSGSSGTPMVYDGGYIITGSSNFTINTWQHLAVVRQSGTVKMYLNGTQIGSASWTADLGSNKIGYIGYNGSQPYYGYIDDLRITKGYARYTANFTPPTSALPVY